MIFYRYLTFPRLGDILWGLPVRSDCERAGAGEAPFSTATDLRGSPTRLPLSPRLGR
jgi:hypothetical protein